MNDADKHIGLLVFDWDGTLVDSVAYIAQSMRTAAGEQDLPIPTVDAVHEIVGLGLTEAVQRLFPQLSEAANKALSVRYSTVFKRDKDEPCQLFDGVRSSLEELRDVGFQLAVATGKSRKGLRRAMQELQMGDLFVASRCADETRSKPDPLMLLELLEELAFAPSHTLMVGDTLHDLNMATNAGVTSIAVDYGAHPRVRLLAAAPLACVSRFSDIKIHINKYFKKII
ncbi:MAG: HAD-IA family hydrolase [Cellvibrionales bacterium]